MHGRLKVKTTAEQQEAKRKEREKKLQIYNGATKKIFGKKKKGELDEELLTLTGEVLAVNPDFYSLWNFRKESFLELQKSIETSRMQSMFQSELYFLESCLKINPKSYGTWHHRCFVLDTMPEPDWGQELQLCNQFLMYDERNFHCWDYRRHVVQRSSVPPEAELEYSLSKISNNFSNYSSWHYRSKLLPVLYPDGTQPMGVSEAALLKEYELVQNGIFTDPDDQSNWFYHRWLMGRGDQKQKINLFYVSRAEQRVIISFTCPLNINAKSSVLLKCNESEISGSQWHNQCKDDTFSSLWMLENTDLPKTGVCQLTLEVKDKNLEVMTSVLTLGDTDPCQVVTDTDDSKGSSKFSQQLSAVKTETLQQELESVSQLLEMETDNKYAALTVVLLMQALDPVGHQGEIRAHLDTLEALDFKRVNYYKDLRSRFIIETLLTQESVDQPGAVLHLANSGLTKLCHPELLPLVTHLDLGSNALHEVAHFGYLQSVVSIDLSGNNVESCRGLAHLPHLETLSLKNNAIIGVEDLHPLTSCPSLIRLDISGNPVCQVKDITNTVKALLPRVNVIYSCS